MQPIIVVSLTFPVYVVRSVLLRQHPRDSADELTNQRPENPAADYLYALTHYLLRPPVMPDMALLAASEHINAVRTPRHCPRAGGNRASQASPRAPGRAIPSHMPESIVLAAREYIQTIDTP